MNVVNEWASLFSSSTFFCYKKNEELTSELKDYLSQMDYKNIETFHPHRKEEYLLGRICAAQAYKMHFGKPLIDLPTGPKREPMWPAGVIGSLTHNENWAGAVVSESKTILGVGIDFETMGRAKIKLESYISFPGDVKEHLNFSSSEVLTLVFSAKESLYKALYPTVNCFFGFEAAIVKSIDAEKGAFEIDLVIDIAPGFGPSGRRSFNGRFKVVEGVCLTVIEVPNLA
jgi:enterobactin synthetase component D